MFPEYAGICGITKEEMLTQMSDYIDNLAGIQGTTGQKIVEKLTDKYDVKINKSAKQAIKQIEMKDYPARFALNKLPIAKVGINFSLSERTITDWIIE